MLHGARRPSVRRCYGVQAYSDALRMKRALERFQKRLLKARRGRMARERHARSGGSLLSAQHSDLAMGNIGRYACGYSVLVRFEASFSSLLVARDPIRVER